MTRLLDSFMLNEFILMATDQLVGRVLNLLMKVNWSMIARVAAFNLISLVMVLVVFVVNDRLFSYFNSRRLKKHRMTIRNRGNVPSIFLLRTIELPKQLSVRFRIGDSSMITVTHKPEEPKTEQPKEEAAPKAAEPDTAQSDAGNGAGGLIPDLNKPLDLKQTASDATQKAVKTVGDTGRKVGLIAGIIGSISNLLPGNHKTLNEAQGALKGVQQDANNVVGTVNQKTGNISTLSNQVNSLTPDSAKKKDSGGKNGTAASPQQGTVSGSMPAERQKSLQLKDLTYDEEVWRKNIGKTDEKDGSLLYAQSKILKPGESMEVSVEIMNLSESNIPLSYMYRIEVLQIPQTKLPLAAPRQYISGVVAYQRISRMTRILPVGISILMIMIAIQIIALVSYWLF